ncbi:uncharacterized protein LOC135485639 [Lineus longissimus]|uniref:uncharacterized protein LOC135485639 n=1 Tax=Lineus longissimus TaxID=88925 RepID=UPI002B4CB410
MENSTIKGSEELDPWDAEFEVEDTSPAEDLKDEKMKDEEDEVKEADEGSPSTEVLNKQENYPVDSPDIAVSRSPKPKKPKKDKKKKNAKKKDIETLNGEMENLEMGGIGEDGGNDEEDEELEKEIQMTAPDADGQTRNSLFEKGVQLDRKKKKDLALKCYLRCLNGLRDDTGFTYVPQCLHNIADIYYGKEEFDKAVQFIQAEKMYYETALIDTSELQKKLEEKQKEIVEEGDDDDDPLASTSEALRATEYHHLAQLCLDKKQPQLALEYCGKATKLRQQVYGENHPISLKTLDFFTIVYAEAGKQQYSDSMKKFTEEDLVNLTDLRLSGGDVDGLRKRLNRTTNKSVNKSEDKKVHFEEPAVQFKPDEEQMSRTLLWIFFLISTAVLAVLGIYLYCRLNHRSPSCHNFGTTLSYYYARMKYFYYYYTSSDTDTYG